MDQLGLGIYYMGSFTPRLNVLIRMVLVAGLVWFSVLLATCGPAPNSESAISQLDRGLSGDPETLDPHRSTSNQALSILRDIGEGLVSHKADGTLEPGVAHRWEESDDHLTLTFFLRPEARWSDGSDVIASDFVFSFQRLVDPVTAAPYAEFVSAIVNAAEIVRGDLSPDELGVIAVDRLTIEIQLHTPTPHFLEILAHPSTFPTNKTAFLVSGEKLFTPEKSVSNGAYVLDERVVGSSITLRRNSLYWNDRSTSIDMVTYHVVDQDVEYDRYRAGELDITANVPVSIFSLIRKERSSELRVAPYLGIYYYGFNLTKPPFANNQKLRQALSIAIDRQVLVEKITGRGEIPAYTWVPPGVNNYGLENSEFENMEREDREALARQLFREAGYDSGDELDFELRYNTSNGHRRIALAIQGMWRDVLGIEVKLANEEFAVFISSVQNKQDTQVFRMSWTGDYNDALSFLQILKSDNPSNLTAYSNSAYDDLLEQAEREADPIVRRHQLERAEQLAMANYPVIPLYFYVSNHLIHKSITGWEDNVMDVHLTKHLSMSTRKN